MRNPYEILEIGKDATDEEIESARKYQLLVQCGNDVNKKDENGEYIQEVINEAAANLLNPEKRKEIDEKIGKGINYLVPYDSSLQLPSQIVLTKINHELVEQVPKIQLKRSTFEKKVKLSKFFLTVLENHSFIYTVEKDDLKEYWLYEYFTDRDTSNGFKSGKCPWDNFEVFTCDGILGIAYPAYRVFPISIIEKKRISDSTLRAIHPIIQKAVYNMGEEISELFEEYKVKNKGKR